MIHQDKEQQADFAVIFDMDGVITESNPYHKQAWEIFCQKYELELTEKDLQEHVYGQTNKHALTHIFDKELSEEECLALAEEKEAIYRELHDPEMELTPGLKEFLEMLQEHGVRTAVATSAPTSNLEFTLNRLDIRRYFDQTIDISGVKNGKPDPEIYLKAAEKLGVAPEQCIVMEDSVPGVEAGKRAGMTVIGLTTTHSAEELDHTDLTIEDFRGLRLEKLQELLSAKEAG
jgi:beta-phosphoglucomutase